MDEFGFRGGSGDSLSVSYAPAVSSSASRKAASSRSNGSISLSQPSRLPSPRVPTTASSLSAKSSGIRGKVSSSAPVPLGSNVGLPKFRALRNMLPFGPKQPNTGSASSPGLTRKMSNPPVSTTAAQSIDLKHRRSSSSIPTPLGGSNAPKHGFLSVGRRTSLHVSKEKTLPALPTLPPIHRSHSEDLSSHHSPVMTISHPSASTSKVDVTQQWLPLPDDPFKRASPSAIISNSFQRGPSREDLGTIRSRGDLSTIIESELSNMSIWKRSPPLNPCSEDIPRTQENPAEKVDSDSKSDMQIFAQLAEQEDKDHNLSIMHAQDMDVTAATADLSASWEAGVADLRRSLHVHVPGDRRSAASSSCSVSPVSGPSPALKPNPTLSAPANLRPEIQLNSPEVEQEVDRLSFELSTVDPDLATLLDPAQLPTRRKNDASAAIIAAVDSVVPPPPMHSSPSASPSPEPEVPGRRLSADPDALVDGSSRRTSVDYRKRTVGLQSSPVRRSRPSSLALSSDSLPLSDRARRTSIERTPVNNIVQRPLLSPTPRAKFSSPQTSTEDLTETMRLPKVLTRSHSALTRTAASDEFARHRTPMARLYATPSRPSTTADAIHGRVSSDSARPFLCSSQATDELASRLFSPTSRSRPTTSLGVSSRFRSTIGGDLLERPATAFSSIGRGPPPVPARSRKRSLSAATDIRHQARNVPDWMGPRTARAFAAAGLLDTDTDQARERYAPPPIPPRSESRIRLAVSRSSTEREYGVHSRALTESAATRSSAPSRAGYSEQGYYDPSGGRRRASSRTMTMAELASARVDSPVTSATSSSNARTIFSASTATSLSCSSPHHQYQVAHLESEVSSLREKHAAEMEAVLSALVDSQRSSKALRDENSQLHSRIRDLEDQLADLAEQLKETRRASPIPSSFTRSLLHHRRSSPRESPRGSPSRIRTFVRTPVDSVTGDSDAADGHTTVRESGALLSPNLAVSALQSREYRSRTRASTASSIFPVLPNNMSMLLHDEGSDTSPYDGRLLFQSNAYASSAGSPPASPTLNVNRLVTSSIPNGTTRHATTLSLSSIEMSMLSSLPGSPKSLKLKPEDEKHLCDLKSLDFSVIDSD